MSAGRNWIWAAAGVGLGFWAAVRGAPSASQGLELEIEALQGQLDSIQRVHAAIEPQQGGIVPNLERLQAQLERLENAVPRSDELVDLMAELGRVARRNDVEVVSIVPETTQRRARYERHPYAVRAIGSYSGLTRFLAETAAFSLAAVPADLSLRTFDDMHQITGLVSPVEARFRLDTWALTSEHTGPSPDSSSQVALDSLLSGLTVGGLDLRPDLGYRHFAEFSPRFDRLIASLEHRRDAFEPSLRSEDRTPKLGELRLRAIAYGAGPTRRIALIEAGSETRHLRAQDSWGALHVVEVGARHVSVRLEDREQSRTRVLHLHSSSRDSVR